MEKYEQSTNRLEKMSNFFGGSNFSKRNLYKKRFPLLGALGVLLFACSANAADATPPKVITASEEWAKLNWTQDIQSGSALDFSFLLDAPAGKYGPVKIDGEDFVFENAPDKKVRFYGVNLSFWTNELWGHDSIDKLADRLAAAGFNAVRLHAHDSAMLMDGQPSWKINPKAMESFDYLFEALKKRGIYLTTDLLVRRQFKAGEIPGFSSSSSRFGGEVAKALIPVSEAAMENWKKFAHEFLIHKNIYSGIAWKDDPAFLPFSVVNENTIPSLLRCIDSVPEIKALYEQKFIEWLVAKKLTPDSEAKRKALRNRFLVEIFDTAFMEMYAYLRSIGVKQPLTDQNNGNEIFVSMDRTRYDYVDNHFYFDFPRYMKKHGQAPFWLDNGSITSGMNANHAECFVSRLFGKPFMLTEFNGSYPSRFRAEVGAVVPGYSALQGWNGLFLYHHTHGGEKEYLTGGNMRLWEQSKDPLCMLSMRVGAMLFLRGDIKTSDVIFPVLVDEHCFDPGFDQRAPRVLRNLGLVGKVGTVVRQKEKTILPAGADYMIVLTPASDISGIKTVLVPNDKENEMTYLYRCLNARSTKRGFFDYGVRFAKSSTGELEMDGKKQIFKAISPKSEVITVADTADVKGGLMEVKNVSGPALFFASALDDKTLNDSERILLMHLTDTAASGLTISTEEGRLIVEKMGDLPQLGRRAKAEMTLTTGKPGAEWKLHALDLSGKRISTVTLRADSSGKLRIDLDGFATEEHHFAYELNIKK